MTNGEFVENEVKRTGLNRASILTALACYVCPQNHERSHTMFSIREKQEIAKAVEDVIVKIRHPETVDGNGDVQVKFSLHIDGVESWSWADIHPNKTGRGTPNPWNEISRDVMTSEEAIRLAELRKVTPNEASTIVRKRDLMQKRIEEHGELFWERRTDGFWILFDADAHVASLSYQRSRFKDYPHWHCSHIHSDYAGADSYLLIGQMLKDLEAQV